MDPAPTRRELGLEIGVECEGQISPAFPAEHPDASSGPRSSSVTDAPRLPSS
jgi:hypothetical protein